MLVGAAPVGLGPAQRAAPSPPAPSRTDPRPNILFILIDDMGYADLSITGNTKVETPNVDKLASQGVLLTRFYDAAPICSPSRAGFFTGRFPAELNFVTFINDRAANARHGQANWLDPTLPNVASLLKGVGYATAHFGKWHMGGGRDVDDAPWPTAYGFDESLTTFEGLGPRVLVSDEERGLSDQSAALGQGPFFYDRKSNLTQLYASKTLEFVSRHQDQPWFVQLWLNDVHDPWAPDEAQLKEVQGRGADQTDDKYQASIVKMDRAIGNLVDRLKDMGQFDNTLIVLTSDNGPTAREIYYRDGHVSPGSAGALRGRKGSLYEGGIRQPLILSWPEGTRRPHRDETTVAQGVDLFPTFASVAGVKLTAPTTGMDLAPLLKGRTIADRPALFWAFGLPGARNQPGGPFPTRDRAPRLAVRDGHWKLLAEADGSNVQLYDLSTDPNETRNVAAAQPARRDRLKARLLNWARGLPTP
ncbi:sulfatase-like hydrolase/transferase [Sphingomonas sp. ac-8]|uniref:sulfatase-like hydrolase/transferase n=1 Tax=Sphingomonas sp. ac-8 TaxID=3242977 RepID=UPI003A8099E8